MVRYVASRAWVEQPRGVRLIECIKWWSNPQMPHEWVSPPLHEVSTNHITNNDWSYILVQPLAIRSRLVYNNFGPWLRFCNGGCLQTWGNVCLCPGCLRCNTVPTMFLVLQWRFHGMWAAVMWKHHTRRQCLDRHMIISRHPSHSMSGTDLPSSVKANLHIQGLDCKLWNFITEITCALPKAGNWIIVEWAGMHRSLK